MSFGVDVPEPNGDSQTSLFVDWSASRHDVLYVASWPDSEQVSPSSPSDHFNGITVAASERQNLESKFDRWSDFNGNVVNLDATGERTSIDLIAPGEFIFINKLGDGISGTVSGPSFAAPHVTGTVALLQQHAQNQINAGAAGWNVNAQHHEVMKAVLMNSADKIKDDGSVAPAGTLLGMTRTVLDQNDMTWLESEAYVGPVSDSHPLDDQIGAGHLNAKRALYQFSPGQSTFDGGPVPSIGWDYNFTDGFDTIRKYSLASPLPANQFVSLTLAWDRDVFLNDEVNANGAFDAGETFLDGAEPIDLNLYLVPAGSMSIDNAVAASSSSDASVEHIFFQIDSPGQYEIWVDQQSGSDFSSQGYALAWWTDSVLEGDFDGDGIVGNGDLTLLLNNWAHPVPPMPQGWIGQPLTAPAVDNDEQTALLNNWGQSNGAGSISPVPEPSATSMLTFAAMLFVGSGRRQFNS